MNMCALNKRMDQNVRNVQKLCMRKSADVKREVGMPKFMNMKNRYFSS